MAKRRFLVIGGHRVELVRDADIDDDDVRGDFSLTGMLIRTKKGDPDPDSVEKHEAFHAAIGIAGWSKTLGEKREESLVTMLELILGPAIDLKIVEEE